MNINLIQSLHAIQQMLSSNSTGSCLMNIIFDVKFICFELNLSTENIETIP